MRCSRAYVPLPPLGLVDIVAGYASPRRRVCGTASSCRAPGHKRRRGDDDDDEDEEEEEWEDGARLLT